MNKIIGVKFLDDYISLDGRSPITLVFKYEIDTKNLGFDKNFNVSINELGEIVGCSSLASSRDSINYYICMGEILKQVDEFIALHGKDIHKFIMNQKDAKRIEFEEYLEVAKRTIRVSDVTSLIDEIDEMISKRKRMRNQENITKHNEKLASKQKELEIMKKTQEEESETIDKKYYEIDKRRSEIVQEYLNSLMTF